jgi:hypothetical protein
MGEYKMRKALQLGLRSAMAAIIALVPIAVPAQVGTSCADCPNYSGAFSIENGTGTTIHYQYRWGNKHEWKRMALGSGAIEIHSYPLGEDPNKQVPTPYVRFDRIGGDGNQVTWQEYKMEFHAVGYAGFGPKQNKTEPMRYVFRYAANGRDLDLLKAR